MEKEKKLKVAATILKEGRDVPFSKECKKEITGMTNFTQMAKKFFNEDNFAMTYDFPPVDMARKYKAQFYGQSKFVDGSGKKYGMFVDEKGTFENLYKAAFFGDSNAICNYSGFEVATLIVRHNSKVKINASDYAILFVNILDSATVEIECTDSASVTVYQYSEQSTIEKTGNVDVIRKNLYK